MTKDTRWDPLSGIRLNEPATSYIARDGAYVIRNDRTGVIVEVSDRNSINGIAFWRQGKDGIATFETAGTKIGTKVEEKLIGNAAKDEARLAENGAEITTVIGRVKDLKNLEAGERSLLDRLPDLGSPKTNWWQNAGVLREEMRRGLPIRDASLGDTAGQFLNAERNLLRDRGWTFDAKTGYWMPPNK